MLQNGHWRSVAVQVVSEPGSCQGAGFKLRAAAGIRVQVAAGIVMGAEYCKNHDKQMHFIVRVSICAIFKSLFVKNLILMFIGTNTFFYTL
jgi:hypothetical protein